MGGASKNKKIRDRVESEGMEDGSSGNGLLMMLNVPLSFSVVILLNWTFHWLAKNQDRLRNQLKNISYNYIYSFNFPKQKNILSKDGWRALNDLRSDDSIIITKPDKGNGIVIVSRLKTKWHSCFLITPNSNHRHTVPLKLEKRAAFFLPLLTTKGWNN